MKKKLSVIFVGILFISLINQVQIFAEDSVNDLQDKVDESNSKISSNNDEISIQEQKVKDLNEQIKTSENEIDRIKTSFAKNEKKQKKIKKNINDKQKEIKDLKIELDERMEISATVLKTLQRNRNVNSVVQLLFNDEIGFMDKFHTLNSLNQISVRSFQKVQKTISLIEKVSIQKEELKADEQTLNKKQSELKVEGQELLEKSNESENKKIEIIQTITSLKNKNKKEKEKLLANSGLLEEYKNSGCNGKEIYGVNCAVAEPQYDTVNDVINSYSQKNPIVKNDESKNKKTGSYVAKLKADPNANYIIGRESGWNPSATNASSGAYGLCQALPGSKMNSAGSDWRTNIETQAKWCDSYATQRYGSWAGARAFWDINNWF